MIAVSYIMNRKIKKIFLEVISITKIFYINFFFNEVANDQDFIKHRGTRQGGTGQRRMRYSITFIYIIIHLNYLLLQMCLNKICEL